MSTALPRAKDGQCWNAQTRTKRQPVVALTIDHARQWIAHGAPSYDEITSRHGLGNIATGNENFRDTWGNIKSDTNPDFPKEDDIYRARRSWVEFASWGMPCSEAIEILKDKLLLEVGAGTGFWSRLIKNTGGDIIATDKAQLISAYGQIIGKHHPVHPIAGATAVQMFADRDVLMIWPNYASSWAAYAAMAIAPGRKLYLVSEGRGGVVGNNWLFDILQDRFVHDKGIRLPQWPGMRDYLSIYQRI